MTGTDLYKRTHKSVPVIFEPPCIWASITAGALTLLRNMLGVD